MEFGLADPSPQQWEVLDVLRLLSLQQLKKGGEGGADIQQPAP